jgi:glutamyl-tRNA reductase
MISGLKVINLPAGTHVETPNQGELFILETCQRTLVIGFNFVPFHHIGEIIDDMETYVGTHAYTYLLETICGLKSKLLGENEITSQFKKSYSSYLSNEVTNSQIMSILEKLFKDAKQIRTSFLKEIGQQTYAGISRKLLMESTQSGEVLIVGSGALAEDLLKLLDRRYDVAITARNPEKVKKLIERYPKMNIKHVSWEDKSAWTQYSNIMNTIGSNTVLFNHGFFRSWDEQNGDSRLFVDLGSPSVLETSYSIEQSVYRLDDIFHFGETLNQKKQQKVQKAQAAIEELVIKRKNSFALSFPFGWEELQFA